MAQSVAGPRRFEVVRTIQEGEQSLLLRRVAKGATPVLELVLGNVVLLSSAALETERVFGNLAKAALADTGPKPRVLVGGLGFGATLRGVLEVATADTEIVVVEKLAAVIDIARAEASEHLEGALDDPRVVLHAGDVADVIADASAESFSAILFDVDNGPEWASFRSNARLYADAALGRTHRALRRNGIFAVWSGYPADRFVGALRRAAFVPRIEPLLERGVVRARAYIGRA